MNLTSLTDLGLAPSDAERLKAIMPVLFERAEADIMTSWKIASDADEREALWHELGALERLRSGWEELIVSGRETSTG